MALYVAEHCAAEVVGITLSKEQRELAEELATAKGLAPGVVGDGC
jgi:cyclopropane-fatty-acyl-phospholipid synthase